MGKLTWEWGDKPDQIIIRKARGKLTVDEIVDFLNESDQIIHLGEGMLCVIAWRNSTDTYSGWEHEETQGDAQDVFVLGDDSRCFCGAVLHPQFCPQCGAQLYGGDKQ